MSSFLTILSVIGKVVSVIGAFSASRAEADVLSTTAAIRDREAAEVRARAAAQAETTRRTALRRQGARVSAFGSTGLDVSGSALDVLADAAAEEELQIRNIVFEGEAQATSLGIQGDVLRKEAKTVKRAGLISAGTTLLTASSEFFGPKAKSTTTGTKKLVRGGFSAV
jgi:hypothetical protein